MPRALGVGGVFFKADDPEALMAWYRTALGLTVDGPSAKTGAWGVSFEAAALPDDVYLRLAAAPPESRHFDGQFMINFIVDDLDGVLANVREHGGVVLGETELDGVGRFGWFTDPNQNRVELWEPVDSPDRP